MFQLGIRISSPNHLFSLNSNILLSRTIKYTTSFSLPTLRTKMSTSSSSSTFSTSTNFTTPLISTATAEQYINKATFIDSSWYLPAMNRTGLQEYNKERIPTAVFFDINGPLLSDTKTSLPHMLPSTNEFAEGVAKLGISHNKPIIVYDGHGLFSAARVWWTFTVFGHKQVTVLDGGLPLWKKEERILDTTSPAPLPTPVPVEPWTLNTSLVRTMSQINRTIADRQVVQSSGGSTATLRETEIIVDARPYPRFIGEAPEPRAGLSCGHIPLSRSVPFNTLLDTNNQLLSLDEVKKIFYNSGIDYQRPGTITTTCGSGVTASVLFLALVALGRPIESLALYDGAFAEYGSIPSNCVDKGAPLNIEANKL